MRKLIQIDYKTTDGDLLTLVRNRLGKHVKIIEIETRSAGGINRKAVVLYEEPAISLEAAMAESLNQSLHEAYAYALNKHGYQPSLRPEDQFIIVAEEHGEIARAMQDRKHDPSPRLYKHIYEEIDQNILMLLKLRWYLRLEEIDNDTNNQ